MRLAEFIFSPSYLFDSKISHLTKSDSVFIRVNKIAFNKDREVKKVSGVLLPFIILNYQHTLMEVHLGEIGIQPNYRDFLTESLCIESARSGNYIPCRDSTMSGYTLDISVDSCHTKGLYKRNVFITALDLVNSATVLTFRNEKAFPSMTTLMMTAVLSKGGLIVAKKNYSVTKMQPFFKSDLYRFSLIYDQLDRERFVFSQNMVEGLSLSTKQCIENIVFDLNSVLANKSR